VRSVAKGTMGFCFGLGHTHSWPNMSFFFVECENPFSYLRNGMALEFFGPRVVLTISFFYPYFLNRSKKAQLS
jgi:hypothetical protein